MHPGNKPKIITPPPGPKALDVIHKDNVLISPSLSRSAPLVGVETQGVWLKDIDDNIFLDFGSGIAVANVGHRERLAENAAKLGDYILKRLHEIAETHEIIGDLRGKGLMIGIELVRDKKTKMPATQARNQIILDAFKHGLLLLAAGPSSLRLAPPLILTYEQADSGFQIIGKVIDTVEKNSKKT